MVKIFLAFGSNVGNRKNNIDKAIELLKKKVHDVTVSPYYLTRPVGFADQENFINAALVGQTTLDPQELLILIRDTEKKIGRIKRFKNGPREIDIDILFYGDLVYTDNDLVIPHPAIASRDFVLRPLVNLDKQFIHPVLNQTVEELYSKIKTQQRSIISGV